MHHNMHIYSHYTPLEVYMRVSNTVLNVYTYPHYLRCTYNHIAEGVHIPHCYTEGVHIPTLLKVCTQSHALLKFYIYPHFLRCAHTHITKGVYTMQQPKNVHYLLLYISKHNFTQYMINYTATMASKIAAGTVQQDR